MEKKYRKGEVVWAKIRGYPWWPGVIKNITMRLGKGDERETKYTINFIGDNSHANLPSNKIDKFVEKFEEYSNTRHKGLLNSIPIAKKIYKEEIPIDKLLVQRHNVNLFNSSQIHGMMIL
jgi:hypothetical protein